MIKLVVILQVFLYLSLTAQAQDEPGKVFIGQTRTLNSEILDETRTIKVWLPESYAKSSATYPVMYLLDAEMSMRFAKAAATVAELGDGKIPEMIVVGIDNTNRNRDVFPGKDGVKSGADDFLAFLTGELFPQIDNVFRTTDYRILTGHSNSALFVVYALMKQPESFNSYFAISPMLGWRKPEMLGLARQSFANFPNRNTFLYIEYGEQDYDHVINVVPEFIEILEEIAPMALKYRVDVLPGEGHVPYTSYRDALLALFPDFQMEEEDLARGIEAIDEHYRVLTQRYGFKIEAPVDPLVEFGELMLEQNDHEKAIEALEIAASRYPENVASYYRLGQAYEAADRLPEALATYKRLLELYPQSSTIKVKVADLEKTVGQQGTEE
jgi:predicted alpha/beta superfamily hydrolase